MTSVKNSTPSLDPSMDKQSELDTDVELGQMPDKAHEDTTIAAPEPINPYHPSQIPDGGKDAWLCLLGAACCLFCSFGWLNCVGVFQSYYQTHQLSAYSSSTVAWISSLEIFMMFFPGPIVGFLFDNYGPKPLLFFGLFFHVFGIMMTSLCKEYWQFILAQGICSPLGLNAIFNAAVGSLPQWFFKKRGMTFGITAAGSGLGGVIFPIMASHLIPEVGFGWAMRICAFLIFALLSTAILTVKTRLPPKKRTFELKVFLEPFLDFRFNILCVSSFIFFFGLFIPIDFIEVQALASGMSIHLASYLIPILNAASIFGRIVPGALADKLGRNNMQAFVSYLAGIVVLSFGIASSGNAAFILYAACYGFASGGFVSLAPAQITFISKVEQIGVRMGVLFSCCSFAGLAANPVAGQIVKHGFDKMSIFSGVLLLGGAVCFTFARMYFAQWKLFVKI